MRAELFVAAHAVAFLAHKGSAYSSSALADNICTPAPRVRKVMGQLVKAGIVEAVPGRSGGYGFSVDPDAVTLADIALAIDDTPVTLDWTSGGSDPACLVSMGMADVETGILANLNLAAMDHLRTTTIASIVTQLEK